MKFDYLYQQHHSNRYPVVGKNGMVATSQPLAAEAGLEILKKGGNAVDAAVATAACLTVVEPTSNGIGGDAFAIIWLKDELIGMNSSGKSPESISIDDFEEMPKFGWKPITVPGVPKAWGELIKKYGNLTLSECLAPAVKLAEEGYAVTPVLGKNWARAAKVFSNLEGKEFEEWSKTFLIDGKAPEIGEVIKLPNHAKTLAEIGESNSDSFYYGALAKRIEMSSDLHNGYLKATDLAKHEVDWVKPISIDYNGYTVWELPPNGQGIVALAALNIFKHTEPLTQVEYIHNQLESLKYAFTIGKYEITDPNFTDYDFNYLLSDKFGKEMSSKIGTDAYNPKDEPYGSGTVYLATADKEGNMVSYIQSNYMGFGSGVVVEDTGISLQNRGADFKMDKDHPNRLEPGKRTYHTIIPGFITKNNEPVGPFGVMGGYMQPQGHMQVVCNLIDHNMNPQMALDAPRWQWIKDKEILLESSFEANISEKLNRMGHITRLTAETGSFGRGQIIIKNKFGTYVGGTESRTDGHIAVY